VIAALESGTGLDRDRESMSAEEMLFTVLTDEGEEPTVADFVAAGREDAMEMMIGLFIDGMEKRRQCPTSVRRHRALWCTHCSF
jgi:hypothetical protein